MRRNQCGSAQRLSASSEDSLCVGHQERRSRHVLNAFRHQRLSASSEDSRTSAGWRCRSSLVCSTPFGIIGRLTGQGNPGHCNAGLCSTPFGIIGRLTRLRTGDYYSTNVCSTPFGIIGRLTRVPRSQSRPGEGCSTPFGIIGRLTKQRRPAPQHVVVLNAFRHHRKTHSDTGLVTYVLTSAQRLSASSEDSLFSTSSAPTANNVLNAFRHHRKTHVRFSVRLCVPRMVLNAFRHHRKTHTQQTQKVR